MPARLGAGAQLAHIVVYIHEYDSFRASWRPFSPAAGGYFLARVLRAAASLGHTWRVVRGPRRSAGDVAILHVDATIVDAEYLELAGDFAHAINFRTADISKRKVSGAVLAPDSAWEGPVIIKSNLNFAGYREAHHNRIARRRRRPAPHPGATHTPAYTLLEHVRDVPEEAWSDPAHVVERFMPETVEDGYAARYWVFLGERESCLRHVSNKAIIKGANTMRVEPAAVPAALREKRQALGFDYGKFDFVERDGEVVLLDANRTPGAPGPELGPAKVNDFAHGLHALISGAA